MKAAFGIFLILIVGALGIIGYCRLAKFTFIQGIKRFVLILALVAIVVLIERKVPKSFLLPAALVIVAAAEWLFRRKGPSE